MPGCHSAFSLALWIWAAFSIGFNSNTQRIPLPSRYQPLSCKNLSASEEELIHNLLLPGETLQTLPFLPWATLQNTLKKNESVTTIFMNSLVLLAVSESRWEHTSVWLDFHLGPHCLVSFYWRSSLNCPGFKAVSLWNCRDVSMGCWCFQEGGYWTGFFKKNFVFKITALDLDV